MSAEFMTTKEFTKRVDEELIAICDFGKSVGRPRKCVIGHQGDVTKRLKITRNEAERVVKILRDQHRSNGGVFQPELFRRIEADKLCREFGGDRLSALSAFSNASRDAHPLEAGRKTAGSIIAVGKRGALHQFIRFWTITPLELQSAIHLQKALAATRSATSAARIEVLTKCWQAMGARSFEQAYIEEVERYQFKNAAE